MVDCYYTFLADIRLMIDVYYILWVMLYSWLITFMGYHRRLKWALAWKVWWGWRGWMQAVALSAFFIVPRLEFPTLSRVYPEKTSWVNFFFLSTKSFSDIIPVYNIKKYKKAVYDFSRCKKKMFEFQVLFPYKEPTSFFTQFQLRSCPCSLYSCKNNLPRTLNAKCSWKDPEWKLYLCRTSGGGLWGYEIA